MLTGAEGAHHVLATYPQEIADGVWLMSEPEAATISDPLASIVGRRVGGDLVSPDIGDAINALLALVAYVTTNGLKAFAIRRAVRRQAAMFEFPPPPEDTEEQA